MLMHSAALWRLLTAAPVQTFSNAAGGCSHGTAMVRERVGHFGKAYDVKTPDDNIDLYGKWASTYDQDLASYGYKAPAVVVAEFRKHFRDLGGKVLDAGANTCSPTLTGTGFRT